MASPDRFMTRFASIFFLAAALALQGSSGCSSPTAQFDQLRDASAAAVAGTNTIEVLQ